MSASVARIGAPMFSRLYRFDRALRRKLTPAGWLVLGLAIAGAIFGLNTRESLIYQVFGLSVGLLLIAAVVSMRFNVNARVTRALPRVATAGVAFEYTVTVANLGDRSHEGGRRASNWEFATDPARRWGAAGPCS